MTSRVASVALRAVRFEAFGQTEEGYTTISEDECRNFVLNNDTFRSEIDEHPYDTDKYTEEFINKIINPELFARDIHDYAWMPLRYEDSYYADMVCNKFWKLAATEYENGESEDPNDVYDIIFDYINSAEN